MVARASGGCEPAGNAVVIENSADLNSRSLAQKFRQKFRGTQQLIDFSQAGDFGATPAGTPQFKDARSLAETVCEELRTNGPSIVYWSARTRDFAAFVNALDSKGTCTNKDLTVLGQDELANVALTGALNDKDWLRLYYTGFRIPPDDHLADPNTKQFATAYNQFVPGAAKNDPWHDNSDAAVAYDAFHVLSRAADMALSDQGGVNPDAMITALRTGITFAGATGYVSYDEGTNQPPRDKTLVLLRQTKYGPVVAVACGAYRMGESSQKQGPPCSD